jgi:hypothetical protein
MMSSYFLAGQQGRTTGKQEQGGKAEDHGREKHHNITRMSPGEGVGRWIEMTRWDGCHGKGTPEG